MERLETEIREKHAIDEDDLLDDEFAKPAR